MKHKTSLIAAIVLVVAGCVLRFAMPGHDFLGYALWGIAVLVFLFPRLHRVGRIVLGVLVCAGVIVFAVFEIPVVRDARTDTDAHPDAIIVLGAGVNGETPSLTLRTRIDAAAAYLEEHPNVPVVLSGGQGPGEAITEAECMRRALVRRGVDESRLYPEERSTSTQENLRYSRAILEELGVDPARRVAIVTSDFHLCRARLMWGGDIAAVPAHLPSALYFRCLSVNYFIREAFGLAAYFVYGG